MAALGTVHVELPWCGATTEVGEGLKAVVYRCQREIEHGGTVHAGRPIDSDASGYCQWLIDESEQP